MVRIIHPFHWIIEIGEGRKRGMRNCMVGRNSVVHVMRRLPSIRVGGSPSIHNDVRRGRGESQRGCSGVGCQITISMLLLKRRMPLFPWWDQTLLLGEKVSSFTTPLVHSMINTTLVSRSQISIPRLIRRCSQHKIKVILNNARDGGSCKHVTIKWFFNNGKQNKCFYTHFHTIELNLESIQIDFKNYNFRLYIDLPILYPIYIVSYLYNNNNSTIWRGKSDYQFSRHPPGVDIERKQEQDTEIISTPSKSRWELLLTYP